MKKYNIIEVMNSEVGSKFKCYLKETKMWVEVEIVEKCNRKLLCNSHDKKLLFVDDEMVNLEFEKVKEPISFTEVLANVIRNPKILIKAEHRFLNSYYEYITLCDFVDKLKDDFFDDELADILLNSEWYVEEE